MGDGRWETGLGLALALALALARWLRSAKAKESDRPLA
jgi:hypothetical protein